MSVTPSPPQYKGADLDPARGPGLGCFWIQVAILATFVVLTPVGVLNGWPEWLTAGMLLVVIVLLFFVGQTAIFLLRLVTAERRGRRRPLASRTPTVGDLEEAARAGESGEPGAGESGESGESGVSGEPGQSGVRE